MCFLAFLVILRPVFSETREYDNDINISTEVVFGT